MGNGLDFEGIDTEVSLSGVVMDVLSQGHIHKGLIRSFLFSRQFFEIVFFIIFLNHHTPFTC